MEKTNRKTRSDKDTRRKGMPPDKFYSFRLSQARPGEDNPQRLLEQEAIDFIGEYLSAPKTSMRQIVVGLISHFKGIPPTRETQLADLHQSFSQELARFSATIDRLIASGVRLGGQSPTTEENTSGVNMAYLKRIQETLRGKK